MEPVSHVIEEWPPWRVLGVKDGNVELGSTAVFCGYTSHVRLWTINPYLIAKGSFTFSIDKIHFIITAGTVLNMAVGAHSESAASMANWTQVYHLGNALGEETFQRWTTWYICWRSLIAVVSYMLSVFLSICLWLTNGLDFHVTKTLSVSFLFPIQYYMEKTINSSSGSLQMKIRSQLRQASRPGSLKSCWIFSCEVAGFEYL